jgi:hypothetical protein
VSIKEVFLMRGPGIGTSLILIAAGAILAFAIDYQLTGIDINTVGWILILVGLVGLVFSFLVLGGMTTGVDAPVNTRYVDTTPGVDTMTTTPHEHRQVESRDVVYERDDNAPRVERETRIRH